VQGIRNPLRTALIAGLISLPLLAACGGAASTDNTSNVTNVNVDLNDTSITLSTSTVKAGKVHFAIKNASQSELHELVVVQTDAAGAQLPMDDKGGVAEDKVKSMGEKGDIEHGASADLTLDLPAGHYTLICNQPGHFRQGMHTDLTVS